MNNQNAFRNALIISLMIHGGLLLRAPFLNFFSPLKPISEIEVTYLKLKQSQTIKVKDEQAKRSIELNKEKAHSQRTPPPFLIEKDSLFSKQLSSSRKKPKLTKPDIISVKKIIQLKSTDIGKIKNSTYLNYYQIVREKIRRCAYQNYTRSDTGQVYMTFVVLADGALGDLKLINEKSTPNVYLKNIALRSIRRASPFPSFPPELNYPKLTFNVIISFEIE